jgi:hypothetical protein
MIEQKKMDRLIIKVSNDPDVIAMVLHGSQAIGQAHALSDIDIAFLLDAKVSFIDKHLELYTISSEKLETEQVDVVILNQASLDLSYHVLEKGKILYVDPRRRNEWVDFRERVTLEYLDYAPTLSFHYIALSKRIKTGHFAPLKNPIG